MVVVKERLPVGFHILQRRKTVANENVASNPGADGISRWWRVVGCLSMNLALGSLYAWSVFVAPLEKEFGWKRAQTSNVFTYAVVVFALTFIVAGRLQDKYGPFWVSLTGGVLVSLGFFLRLHAQLDLPVCVFRSDWWAGQRIWLLHAYPGDGQMVSR